MNIEPTIYGYKYNVTDIIGRFQFRMVERAMTDVMYDKQEKEIISNEKNIRLDYICFVYHEAYSKLPCEQIHLSICKLFSLGQKKFNYSLKL